MQLTWEHRRPRHPMLLILALPLALGAFRVTAAPSPPSPPTITEHPQDWILDWSNFANISFTTNASIHDPSGIAKFTCNARGTPPISYRWYVFPINASSLPSPLSVNSSAYWTSGPVLIVLQMRQINVICEAFNNLGAVKSRLASLSDIKDDHRHLINVSASPSSFPPLIFACSIPTQDTNTEAVEGGYITHYTGGNDYSYRYSVENETNKTIEKIKVKWKSLVFIKGPFIVLSPSSIPEENSPITYQCIKQWKASFLVYPTATGISPRNSGTRKRLPELLKSISVPATSIKTGHVQLHLLYVNPPNAKPRRRYQIGDDLELICIAVVPADDESLKVTWRRVDSPLKYNQKEKLKLPSRLFGAMLKIPRLQMSDAGRYECRATSKSGASVNVSLTLSPDQPVIFTSLRSIKKVSLVDGETLTLYCAFNAQRHVAWLHNGRVLTRGVTVRGTTSLLQVAIVDAEQHQGVYQCAVQEVHGSYRTMFSAEPASSSTPRPSSVTYDPSTVLLTDYAIRTVAYVQITAVNRFPPSIRSQYGVSFVIATTDVNVTTLVIVDKDRGSGGRLGNCSVTKCSRSTAACPHLQERQRSATDNFVIADLSFPSGSPQAPGTLSIDILCSDRGRPPRTRTLSLCVHICNAAEPKCKRQVAVKSASSARSQLLLSLAEADVTTMNSRALRDHVHQVKDVTDREAHRFSSFDLTLAVDSVQSTVDRAENDPTMLPGLMPDVTHLLGNLHRVPAAVLRQGQLEEGIARRLLDDVDRITRLLPANSTGQAWRSSNLVLGAIKTPKSTLDDLARLNVVTTNGNVTSASVVIARGKVRGAMDSQGISISIQTSSVLSDSIDFSFFVNDSLFASMLQDTNNSDNSTLGRQLRLVSPVIAARAALAPNASDPVTLVFRHNLVHRKGSSTSCAFWNFTTNAWETSGCRVVQSSSSRTVCQCSHLTNFALLLAVDRQPVDPQHKSALQLLSIVLLATSCVALTITLLIYLTFLCRELRAVKSGRTRTRATLTAGRILVSFCVALLAAHLVFLIGGRHQADDPACKAVAVLLHYFYLAAFAWSVVEGVNVFVSFVYLSFRKDQVQTRISHFFLKASLAAWGIPGVVVIVTLATNIDNYGLTMASDHNDGLCFLRSLPFYLAFLLPFLLCLVTNAIVAVLLIVVLRRQSRFAIAGQKTDWRQRVVGFVGVCLLLNLTWILGTLQIGVARLALGYLFVLVNGVQGVLVFIFFCVVRNEIRQHMVRLLRRQGLAASGSSIEKTTTQKRPSDQIDLSKISIDLTSRKTSADMLSEASTAEVNDTPLSEIEGITSTDAPVDGSSVDAAESFSGRDCLTTETEDGRCEANGHRL